MQDNFLPTNDQLTDLIKLAYQTVLKREVDPTGLADFTRKIQDGIRAGKYTSGLQIVNVLGKALENSVEFNQRFPGQYADLGSLTNNYYKFLETNVTDKIVNDLVKKETDTGQVLDEKSIDETMAESIRRSKLAMDPYYQEYESLLNRQTTESVAGVNELFDLQKKAIETTKERGIRDVKQQNVGTVTSSNESLAARGLADTGVARNRFSEIEGATGQALGDIGEQATQDLLGATARRDQSLREIETTKLLKSLSMRMAQQQSAVSAAF